MEYHATSTLGLYTATRLTLLIHPFKVYISVHVQLYLNIFINVHIYNEGQFVPNNYEHSVSFNNYFQNKLFT